MDNATLDNKVEHCQLTREHSVTFKGEQYCGLLIPEEAYKCPYSEEKEQIDNICANKCSYNAK